MKVLGTNLVVEQDSVPDKYAGKVIFEHNKKYTRNCGIVRHIGIDCPKDMNIKIGDIAHFSNEAGVYLDKKELPNMLLIDYREIPMTTPDTNNEIFIGEDLRYYLVEEISARDLNRVSNH